MWIALKIGVFYAAPALAVAAALAWLALLYRRVRRGSLRRGRAAARGLWAFALPLAAVVAIWGVGEIASLYAAGPGPVAWDQAASAQFLRSLLPYAGYVALPIALLTAVFWAMLARWRVPPPDSSLRR
jgi:hypothetical protein